MKVSGFQNTGLDTNSCPRVAILEAYSGLLISTAKCESHAEWVPRDRAQKSVISFLDQSVTRMIMAVGLGRYWAGLMRPSASAGMGANPGAPNSRVAPSSRSLVLAMCLVNTERGRLKSDISESPSMTNTHSYLNGLLRVPVINSFSAAQLPHLSNPSRALHEAMLVYE